jgi:fatty-acid desaturase
MPSPFSHIEQHRVHAATPGSVLTGEVRYSPLKSFWFLGMAGAALIGGYATFTLPAFALFLFSTAVVLLFGHSLGSHRKLIHDSYQCPTWLEYLLVYLGVQVGLAGPLGLLRQHELRDYAQRLPDCHDYLRHGRPAWVDAWWQLNCELHLAQAHNHGEMHYEVRGAAVQGRNIRLTSLLTMGECWHNNHHAYPGSARLGLKDGEWDPGWWVLCMMRCTGLAWNLTLPDDLPERPELVALRSTRSSCLFAVNPR